MPRSIDWHPALNELPFSPIRMMFNTAAKMTDVLHLSIGQPDMPAPPHVIEAYIRALRDGKTRYELDGCLPQLREAITGFYNRRYGLHLEAENILITTGCCQAMYMALTAAVKPGKEVIVIEPVFCSLPHRQTRRSDPAAHRDEGGQRISGRSAASARRDDG